MYDMVIGLEIHIQMNTQTKIFCGCSTSFTLEPNSHTCPICQGHPGVLPLLNKMAVVKALKAAIATHSQVNEESLFDRKSYFYPDLPKGYQITQFYKPICEQGFVEIKKANGESKRIRINHIHIEEDAGKLVHAEGTLKESYVDLNRAGTPLLEIVSEPDIRSAEEAVLFATQLRQMMMYADVTDGNMQQGSMRVDLNLSLMPKGSSVFGTRTETKNLNSFTGIKKAIEMEAERQKNLLQAGKVVQQETRLFNLDKMESRSLRKKGEGEESYLYFREPDIPVLKVSNEWLKEIKDSMPLLPEAYMAHLIEHYGLKAEDIVILLSEKSWVLFFEEAARDHKTDAQKIANFFLSELLGILKDKKLELQDIPLTGQEFGDIFKYIKSGEISLKMAKDLLPIMVTTGKNVSTLIQEKGLTQLSDVGEIEGIIKNILATNDQNVQAYHAGKVQVFGFFVGQIMKESKGKANPSLVNEILKKLLDEKK